MPVTEIQETIYELVRDVALLACACVPKGGPPSPLNRVEGEDKLPTNSPSRACLGCRARALLEDVVARGIRIRRWRQKAEPVVATVHVAGAVIACREYRRSCPLYIVDRRQACAVCGAELVRGTWALFYNPGDRVAVIPSRHSVADLVVPARGRPAEIPCAEKGGPRDTFSGTGYSVRDGG